MCRSAAADFAHNGRFQYSWLAANTSGYFVKSAHEILAKLQNIYQDVRIVGIHAQT